MSDYLQGIIYMKSVKMSDITIFLSKLIKHIHVIALSRIHSCICASAGHCTIISIERGSAPGKLH